MLKGTFTTMQPSYDDDAAQLTVSGLNVLHQLRRKQYTTTWTDKKDSEIALDISQRTTTEPSGSRCRSRSTTRPWARRSRSRW